MSNFICEKCGMTNIDCGYQGYKTEREIELEKQLDREIKINRKMKNVLEIYADPDVLYYIATSKDKLYKLAQQVLKEIDNKE